MPADSRRKMRREHSAGGAVISLHEGRPHVAMIATRGKTRWGLPKGAVARDETPEQAAVREVLEETGLEAEISSKLETIEYYFRAGDTLIHKFVDFFLMRHTGGELRPQLSEVDDVAWVPIDEAVARASFDSEKKLLKAVTDQVSRETSV
jgi:8-oxo-dGTP pyrophosphatase MutT (NUDIX family)